MAAGYSLPKGTAPQVSAGRMRHRIQLQSPGVPVKNAIGEEEHTWTNSAVVWAEIIPLRGEEWVQARQVNAKVTHRVRIRYRPDIALRDGWRFLFRNRKFYLAEPPRNVDDERCEAWEFLAIEEEPPVEQQQQEGPGDGE